MPQEIERKYLLSALPEGLGKGEKIRQGYLSVGDPEIRLRTQGSIILMTRKSGEGLVRDEREVSIRKEVFDMLWPLTHGARVEKVRYTCSGADYLSWEIDEYGGELAGLFIAEVELYDANREAVMPDSIIKVLIKEVTDDPAYKNKSLAMHGRPK